MSHTLRVLVVDDERLSCLGTVQQLRDAGIEAEGAERPERALACLAARPFDVVVTDLRMPGMDGLELLARIRRDHPGVEVILMTAYASVTSAVQAMQLGAADYLTKPFRFQELEHRLRKLAELRGYRRELEGLRALLDDAEACPGLVGRSQGMRQVSERVRLFARHDTTVLVTGETGTGKEVVSRALHDLGPRRSGPFVPVPCGAIPGDLAESELFGHERGAFTGATAQRAGAFERAHRGTLLLDDVDDLPLSLQVKLLRVIQEGTVHRVGGSADVRVDVRVVATTKVDLGAAVAAGRFRPDLFYRLRGLEVRLPPLRERGEDVLLIAEHFLRRRAARSGAAPVSLSPEAAAVLRSWSWPGNVRELRQVLETAQVVCPGAVIGPEHLPTFLRPEASGPSPVVRLALEGRGSVSFNEVVREVEDALIAWAMERTRGQQTAAADLLGLPRTTFQSKLLRGT